MAVKMWQRTQGGKGTQRYVWEGLSRGDVGAVVVSLGGAGMTFQVFGEFGVDGKIVLEGSCEEVHEGNHFFVLSDRGDAFVSFWKPGGAAIDTVVTSLRPHVVAGDGDTFLIAVLLVRSA